MRGPTCFLVVITTAFAAVPTCTDRCVTAGHCCTGNGSACAAPSCQMGCFFAAAGSLSACNATCYAAKAAGCSFKFGGTTFQQCGDCSARWLNPATLTPEILPGAWPFWPPGFQLPQCSSCDDISEECYLGCQLAFDPGLNPLPPSPTPPPAVPLPPAPWPNAGSGFNFSEVFSDHIVLQQAPAAAAVYGNSGTGVGDATISVTVTPSTGETYTVPAAVAGGRWKALLRPTPDSQGATTFNITATCAVGCGGASPVTLLDVVFGDVWYCAGQSNQWLQIQFTYANASVFAGVASGNYDNIRLASGDSQSQGLSPAQPPVHPWRTAQAAATLPSSSSDALAQFSAACWHFAEALTDRFAEAGKAPPTLGLVATAIGGSTIEEWIPVDVQESCYGAQASANGADLNHILWDVNVRPFLNMTVKGWLYYQGENNAGSLHGNSAANVGYSCMMPKLIERWRRDWSATPGTTDPLAPFGLVTLSTDDSEGAGDIGSFRFAQSGSYGSAPNAAMPATFIAHAYDLADVWVNCGPAPQTKQCPGCDVAVPGISCLQQWYMGPGIHPRLKKPVGQRLAAAALPIAYAWPGPATGPTLAGCTLDGGSNTIMMTFNATLLAGAPLTLLPYDVAYANRSALSVLVGSSGAPNSGHWVPCNIALTGAAAIKVDLSPLGGATPQAIKYAWGATAGTPNDADVECCWPTASGACMPGQCPIGVLVSAAPMGFLPAHPFLAQITAAGKCLCPTPQTCDA